MGWSGSSDLFVSMARSQSCTAYPSGPDTPTAYSWGRAGLLATDSTAADEGPDAHDAEDEDEEEPAAEAADLSRDAWEKSSLAALAASSRISSSSEFKSQKNTYHRKWEVIYKV